MAAPTSQGRLDAGWLRILRGAALAVIAAGAAGSVGITMYAGRRNPSQLLVAAFVIWVVSPFLALSVAHGASKRWPVQVRVTLYVVMLALAIGSVALYSARLLWPPRAQAAFVFVVVPPASWAIAALVLTAAWGLTRAGRIQSGGV